MHTFKQEDNRKMKLGDKVRFVSEVGGGTVTGFQGKNVVLVEDEDGFEIPMLRQEVVVIDEEKERKALPKEEKEEKGESQTLEQEPCDRPITFRAKPIERAGGNVLNVMLAIVPSTQHHSLYNLYIINDCNYQLSVQLLREQGMGWMVVYQDTLIPNSKIRVCELHIDEVNEWEHLCVQLLASKVDKPFALKMPQARHIRLQPMKFHRPATFMHTPFFSEDAWLIEVVKEEEKPV